MSEVIKAYKGFDANMQCRGFQFEIGATYEHQGKVKACEGGFHSCEYALDVFRYYPPADSVFAEVEVSGDLSRHNGDSKIASRKITVSAAITIAGLVKDAVDFTMLCIDKTKTQTNTGDQSAATNTGYRSAATNTGDYSAAEVSGKSSVAGASGLNGKAKACKGSAIVLCAYDGNGNLMHIKSAIAGKGKIKSDTWYTLDENGKFVEVQND